jgi:hypothetical protein
MKVLLLLFLLSLLTALSFALPTIQTHSTNNKLQVFLNNSPLPLQTINVKSSDSLATLYDKVSAKTTLDAKHFRLRFGTKELDRNSDVSIGEYGVSQHTLVYLLPCMPRLKVENIICSEGRLRDLVVEEIY